MDLEHLKKQWYEIYHLNLEQNLNQEIFCEYSLDYFSGAKMIEEENLNRFFELFFEAAKSVLLVLSAKAKEIGFQTGQLETVSKNVHKP